MRQFDVNRDYAALTFPCVIATIGGLYAPVHCQDIRVGPLIGLAFLMQISDANEGMIYGYARISTDAQHLTNEVLA